VRTTPNANTGIRSLASVPAVEPTAAGADVSRGPEQKPSQEEVLQRLLFNPHTAGEIKLYGSQRPVNSPID
jgi:hypothetical protein